MNIRKLSDFVCVSLTVTLICGGCATPPVIPPPLDLPARAGESGATLSTVSQDAKRALVLENPVPPTVASKPDTPSARPPAGNADVLLNFDQLPLPAFIQAVYATALKRSISIDPVVSARKDLVTLRSGKSLTAVEAESTARLLLKSYGIAVQDIGDLVRFVPDTANTGYLSEIRRGSALPSAPLPMRPVFQLVELQVVRNTDVAGYLRTLFGDKLRYTEDSPRNSLLLSGNGDDVQAALEAIQVLDQPLFKGRNSIRISPAVWSADELARRLTEILTQEGYSVGTTNSAGAVQFPITLLPVSAINSVIVFAHSKDVIAHIVEWAKVLDKPAEKSTGRNFFSYQVRNTDASRLAETVQQLMTGASVRPSAQAQSSTVPVNIGGGVVVDKATNTILFKASSDDYTDIVRLLRDLDRAARQVLIEVTVAQVTLTDNMSLGVDWIFSRLNSGGRNVTQLGGNTKGPATTLGSFVGLAVTQLDGGGGPRAILNALGTNDEVTLLSSPRVLARNGEQASIQVGDDVPVLTSQQTSSATGGAGLISTVQYRNTGTILKIKPVIHSSDQVDMDISQEVSKVGTSSAGGINSPTISKNSIDTRLTLKHGSTYVLAGLITNDLTKTSSGVPFLKDIPIIGQAFKSSTDKKARSELVILITPYIISDDAEARTVTDAFRKQLGPWAQVVPPAGLSPVKSEP
jgi:general secretion pathway protein D